jgi:hypothetical protein
MAHTCEVWAREIYTNCRHALSLFWHATDINDGTGSFLCADAARVFRFTLSMRRTLSHARSDHWLNSWEPLKSRTHLRRALLLVGRRGFLSIISAAFDSQTAVDSRACLLGFGHYSQTSHLLLVPRGGILVLWSVKSRTPKLSLVYNREFPGYRMKTRFWLPAALDLVACASHIYFLMRTALQ